MNGTMMISEVETLIFKVYKYREETSETFEKIMHLEDVIRPILHPKQETEENSPEERLEL